MKKTVETEQQPVVEGKRKRGRPSGSFKKTKSNETTIFPAAAVASSEIEQQVGEKRARPSDSEDVNILDQETVGKEGKVSTFFSTENENENALVGEKRKRGRPFGSKDSKIRIRNGKENVNEFNSVPKKKDGRGRPKGSKNKIKNDESKLCSVPFENLMQNDGKGTLGRPNDLENKRKDDCMNVVIVNSTADESTRGVEVIKKKTKKKGGRGRRKGSTKKCKICIVPFGDLNQKDKNETWGGPKEKEKKRKAEFSNVVNVNSIVDESTRADEAVKKKKDGRGRPKGSTKKSKICIVPFGDLNQKDKKETQGRPKDSEKKGKDGFMNVANVNSIVDGSARGDEVVKKKKDGRGRPKGSTNKGKICIVPFGDLKLHRKETERNDEYINVGNVNSTRVDEFVKKKKDGRGRPKGSTKKSKICIVPFGDLKQDRKETKRKDGYINVANGNSTVDESTRVDEVVKKKSGRGRPKGSTNRSKICVVPFGNSNQKDNKEMRGKLKDSENKRKDYCMNDVNVNRTVDESPRVDDVVKKKDARGRPKGSTKKRKLLLGLNDVTNQRENVDTESGNTEIVSGAERMVVVALVSDSRNKFFKEKDTRGQLVRHPKSKRGKTSASGVGEDDCRNDVNGNATADKSTRVDEVMGKYLGVKKDRQEKKESVEKLQENVIGESLALNKLQEGLHEGLAAILQNQKIIMTHLKQIDEAKKGEKKDEDDEAESSQKVI